jgi:hypothetical protein
MDKKKQARSEDQGEEKKLFREVDMGDFDPYEINFLPQFREDRGPEKPFINEHGVLIGDHVYESPNSPLEKWTENTDPAIMSGDQWVHPYKDIGFHTEENRDYFEKGILPDELSSGARFMHPDKDVAYDTFESGEPRPENGTKPSGQKEEG